MTIWTCCLLTVVIELAFMMICGYRSRYEITVIVCANVVSNLLLNLLIIYVFRWQQGLWIIPMELAVAAGEYLYFAHAFGGSRRLLLLTALSNMISYLTGLLIAAFLL